MTPSTRITGRALRLAQALWLCVAVVYIGLYLAGLPRALTHVPAPELPYPDWTLEETQSAYAALGLSVDTFASVSHWLNIALNLGYIAAGLFLFWQRRDDWMALLLSVNFLVFVSTDQFTAVLGASPLTARLDTINSALGSALVFPIFFLFPNGRFVPRWTRWVALYLAGVQAWRIFYPDQYDQAGLALTLPFFLAMPVAQVYRYFRAADPIQRVQIKWVVAGLVAMATPLAVFGVLSAVFPELRQPSVPAVVALLVGTAAWSGFLIVWPLTLSIAILRYRLFDIDVIIRRTLIYSVLTGLLALVYFGTVITLEGLLRGVLGGESPLAIVLSTLVIAALAVPLRGRIQRAIDRRFFRKKYDATRTLAAFGAQARDVVELEQLTSQLVRVVDETMQPASVGLWVRGPAKPGGGP